MQYTSKEIYKEVSLENNIDLDKVKLVGNAIFQDINKRMKSPTSIILRIKGLGYFFLRNIKMKKFLELEKKKLEFKNEALIPILEDRLKDYERYIEKKQANKKYRIEHGEILKPIEEEEY